MPPASPLATADAAPPRPVHRQLLVLTAAKCAANTALRWVGPFLPTLERAFGTTTATLTGIMGVAELGGLTTGATGPFLDRGHERIMLGTLARSAAVVTAGQLYDAFGISGPVTWSATTAALALGLILFTRLPHE